MKPSFKQSAQGVWIALVILAIFAVFISNRHISAQSPARAKSGSDWADWRGPTRDGHSYEKGLPEKWSKQGENLLWKAPYGGRSAPIVMNGRVFMFNSAGENETLQERVLALDAETGKKIWEYRFNVYSSDVPPRRVAWSSPAGDPTTGNVYAFGACNELVALSWDGKPLWSRSLTDEYGAWTTHGGRTVSPIIEGDLVIVGTVTDGFGDIAARRHRYYAFDKRTGENVWISTPGGRPYDTTYSTPVVATIDGMRILIAGGGDGSVSAMKVNTGEPVWTYPMSKRGVNPGVVVKDGVAYATHQEENLDVSEMGQLAAIDISAKGAISKTSNQDKIKYALTNYQLGPASPVIEGNTLYAVTAESSLHAFNIADGRPLWEKKLGTIQKASPVYADGKIYVGTENGKFYILKPGPAGCEVLDEEELEPVDKIDLRNAEGDEMIASNEQIIGGVAVSRGRIYLVSTKNIYAIGKKKAPALPPVPEKNDNAPAGAAVAHVQVLPAELVMKPGETKSFKVRLFDDRGRFIREEAGAQQWVLDGLKGKMEANKFTAAADGGLQGGQLKATAGNVTGFARVRIIPAAPYSEDFSGVPADKAPRYWLNTDGVPIKYSVREVEGNKVLVKKPDNGIFKRTRSPFGPADASNYTIEADIRAVEKRRQMGDAGVVAQRYELVLFGNIQKIELRSWQIEPARTFSKPFAWKADTWYRLKLQVENLPDGKTRARGKAWPASESEPAEWLIEWTDPIGNREGSPGVFADSANELFFDNIKVTPNK
jgi:outer membrane protein assembly factor BamB